MGKVQALGCIYQISNQRTMGISEEATIEQLIKIVEGNYCRRTKVSAIFITQR